MVVTTYIALRLLLLFTQNAKEPPTIETSLPFLSPMIGMRGSKSGYFVRLRNQYKLPIYTLRLPFQRIYVVNSTKFIPFLQKQWRTVSFAAIAADAGFLVGMSDEANMIMHKDLTNEHSFTVSWPRFINSALQPGKDLEAMNRRAVGAFVNEMAAMKAQGTVRIGLSKWSREIMTAATTEAVWGPQNPYRDTTVAEAWNAFESGSFKLAIFPGALALFPWLSRARETVVAAMLEYLHKGGHKSASGLVHMRYRHHREHCGLGIEDMARSELINAFAVLGNTTPCVFWVIYHIFSDDQVLADIRHEIRALVRQAGDDNLNDTRRCIDLASVPSSCPVLLSTFQEILRFRAINYGARLLLEDVDLGGQYLLRKGGMLMIPSAVQHTDVAVWGDDADDFDHMRFARESVAPGRRKRNPAAFRAFGGGHVLCPGRHFASMEILAFAALMVLQFDVVPVRASWTEPSCGNSPAHAGFPIPDEDIQVEFRPRHATEKLNVYSRDQIARWTLDLRIIL